MPASSPGSWHLFLTYEEEKKTSGESKGHMLSCERRHGKLVNCQTVLSNLKGLDGNLAIRGYGKNRQKYSKL